MERIHALNNNWKHVTKTNKQNSTEHRWDWPAGHLAWTSILEGQLSLDPQTRGLNNLTKRQHLTFPKLEPWAQNSSGQGSPFPHPFSGAAGLLAQCGRLILYWGTKKSSAQMWGTLRAATTRSIFTWGREPKEAQDNEPSGRVPGDFRWKKRPVGKEYFWKKKILEEVISFYITSSIKILFVY